MLVGVISTILFSAILNQHRLPTIGDLGAFGKVFGKIFAPAQCWVVQCQNTGSTTYPQAKMRTYHVEPDGKTRGEFSEQGWGDGTAVEQFVYNGQPFKFLYVDTVELGSRADDVEICEAPLVAGQNYLIWSSPFDGKSSDGTFMEAGRGQEFVFDLPPSLRRPNLRLAKSRLRTVGTKAPSNDRDLFKLVAQGLRFDGIDARDSAIFLTKTSGVSNNSEVDFLSKEFPEYMMNQRLTHTDNAKRAICSYLAYFLGGVKYAGVWLDDMAKLSFANKSEVARTCLSSLKSEYFVGNRPSYGTLMQSIESFTEEENTAYNRFQRTQDNSVRSILARYLVAPSTDSMLKKWIKVFVKTGDEEWADVLARRLAIWTKNPNLEQKDGITLEGLRQKYRDIYGIDR